MSIFRTYLKTIGQLGQVYSSAICLPDSEPGPLQSLSYYDQNITMYPLPGECLSGEPDLERLVKRSDLNVDQLKWAWKTWHNFVGPPMRKPFLSLITLENLAAQLNGKKFLTAKLFSFDL